MLVSGEIISPSTEIMETVDRWSKINGDGF